jgi:hypothetical protein
VVCAAEIPESAVYCRECGHYQSAFKEFISKPDITGLIALISTSAIVFKFLNITFFTPPLAISAYASECEPPRFVLLFSNQGKRPALIQDVKATRYYKRNDARIGEDEITIPLKSKGSPVVEGDKSKATPLTFFPVPNHDFPAARSEASLRSCYDLEYKFAEFGKQREPQPGVPVPCECL